MRLMRQRTQVALPLPCYGLAMPQVVVPGPGGATMKRDFNFHACLGPEVNQADVMELCGIHQVGASSRA